MEAGVTLKLRGLLGSTIMDESTWKDILSSVEEYKKQYPNHCIADVKWLKDEESIKIICHTDNIAAVFADMSILSYNIGFYCGLKNAGY